MADNVNVKDKDGATVIAATDLLSDSAQSPKCSFLPGNGSPIPVPISAGHYETVAASQTDQVMGVTGATGDFLARVLVMPATTSPGAVSIKDGAGSAITIFTGGTVADISTLVIEVGARSTGGAWKLTTGSAVSAIGVGTFTP